MPSDGRLADDTLLLLCIAYLHVYEMLLFITVANVNTEFFAVYRATSRKFTCGML